MNWLSSIFISFFITFHLDSIVIHSEANSFAAETTGVSETTNRSCIILLHGMARSEHSMSFLKRRMQQAGYDVITPSYPSLDRSIVDLAVDTINAAVGQCNEATNIHFVTHSMGGILVRSYLQNNSIENLGRIVMLAPPNHGSELVDHSLSASPNVMEQPESFRQLSAASHAYVNQLKPITADIGIVAGRASINPLFSSLLPGEDDGKVSVASACLEEMREMWVYPTNHTMIAFNPLIASGIEYFLEWGHFPEIEQGERVENCDLVGENQG